ncbi:hypothetical protein TNCV_179381 [Trichonephila clavipes]|nr:hypothetical protein TNCV_179381 [Trichonephila clavipes]
MFQILLWSLWTYRCGQRTVRLADCGSQSQAVFARRRSKSKLKLLDIRAELERRENARAPLHGGFLVHEGSNSGHDGHESVIMTPRLLLVGYKNYRKGKDGSDLVLPVPGSILLCFRLLRPRHNQHNSVGTGSQQNENGEIGRNPDAYQFPTKREESLRLSLFNRKCFIKDSTTFGTVSSLQKRINS